MNFLALEVIAQFDDFFFNALEGNSTSKSIIEDPAYEGLLKITRTTSRNAPNPIDGDDNMDEKFIKDSLFG